MFDQIIQEIERQGFSTRPHLLSPQVLALANELFLRDLGEFRPALVGPASDKKRVESIRGDHTLWIDPLHVPPALQPFFTFLDELKSNLNEKLFLGLRDYEAHLAQYPVGSFYARHLDRHEKQSSRVLSFVCYLNEEWKESDGGELVLYDQQNKQLLKLLPSPGTFVCFLSEDFPHEVKIAQRERRSLTGWIHSTKLD